MVDRVDNIPTFSERLGQYFRQGGDLPVVPNNLREVQLVYAGINRLGLVFDLSLDDARQVISRYDAFGQALDTLLTPTVDPITAQIREVRGEDMARGRLRLANNRGVAGINAISRKTSALENI